MDVYSGEAKFVNDYFQSKGYDFIIPGRNSYFSPEDG